MARQGNGAARVIGGIFAAAGVALLGAGAWAATRQLTILKDWPRIEAVVVESQVTHSTSRDQSRSRSSDMYKTEIVFRYEIEGKTYVTPATSGYSSSSYPEMKRQADAHPTGSRHAIWVNPKDPNDIRYNAGWSFGFFFYSILLGGMGAVFAGLGVVMLLVSRATPPTLCPACSQPVATGQRFCPNCAAPLRSR
jgi:hypothetical protein